MQPEVLNFASDWFANLRPLTDVLGELWSTDQPSMAYVNQPPELRPYIHEYTEGLDPCYDAGYFASHFQGFNVLVVPLSLIDTFFAQFVWSSG